MGLAAVANESIPYAEEAYGFEQVAIVASEMAEDEILRHRADRLERKAAEMAVGAVYESDNAGHGPRYASLLEATHAAAEGEPEAIAFLHSNALPDVVERSIKAGHVME